MAVAETAVLLAIVAPFATAAVGGLLIVRKTYRVRRVARGLQGMAATDVEGVAPGDGLTKVAGTAEPATDELVPAEIRTQRGVARKTRVWIDGAHQRYDVLDVETQAPFVVDDGTGRIPIRTPPEESLKIETDQYSVHTRDDRFTVEEIPEGTVYDWAQAFDAFPDADGLPTEEWNGSGFPREDVELLDCVEGVVELGEEVYAVGEVTTDEDGDLVLTGNDRPEDFVVTDGAEDDIGDSLWTTRIGYAVGGVLFLFGALAVTAFLAGLAT